MSRRKTANRHVQARNGNIRQSFPACATSQHPHILSAQARQAGFTIVEVMVAVVVFAVGLMAIAGMQTQSISQSTLSDQMTMRVNAITHQAETLTRLPVLADTTKNITVNPIFEEANMCEYGEDTCTWSYIDSEHNEPHTVRQIVMQGYPLPNLAMVELETIPQGVTEAKTKKRTIHIAFVRSLRWN